METPEKLTDDEWKRIENKAENLARMKAPEGFTGSMKRIAGAGIFVSAWRTPGKNTQLPLLPAMLRALLRIFHLTAERNAARLERSAGRRREPFHRKRGGNPEGKPEQKIIRIRTGGKNDNGG